MLVLHLDQMQLAPFVATKCYMSLLAHPDSLAPALKSLVILFAKNCVQSVSLHIEDIACIQGRITTYSTTANQELGCTDGRNRSK